MSRSSTDLSGFDAIVLRSCWNYHVKAAEFSGWVRELAGCGVPVWNPPRVLEWNLNKRYLLDLESKGVRVPRTKWIERGSSPHVDLFEELASDRIVVKPAVSLNGDRTHLLSIDDREACAETVSELALSGDVLVQEFVEEIRSAGEISFVFFDGVFSHAVRKVPREGEFRVQVEHGGRREIVVPTRSAIESARLGLDAVGETLLYARVDMVESEEELVLIELEAIDPMLFLGYHDDAPERFARTIASRLR